MLQFYVHIDHHHDIDFVHAQNCGLDANLSALMVLLNTISMLCFNTFVKHCSLVCASLLNTLLHVSKRRRRGASKDDGFTNGSTSTNRCVDIPTMGVRSTGDCVKGNASIHIMQADTSRPKPVDKYNTEDDDTKLLTTGKGTTVKSGHARATIKKSVKLTATTTVASYIHAQISHFHIDITALMYCALPGRRQIMLRAPH
jgi:hypothetical protein